MVNDCVAPMWFQNSPAEKDYMHPEKPLLGLFCVPRTEIYRWRKQIWTSIWNIVPHLKCWGLLIPFTICSSCDTRSQFLLLSTSCSSRLFRLGRIVKGKYINQSESLQMESKKTRWCFWTRLFFCIYYPSVPID